LKPTSIAIADLDRDGDLDLACANPGLTGADLAIFFQVTPRKFLGLPRRIVVDDLIENIRFVTADDLDGDGEPDLILSGAGVPLSIYFGGH
jgi:hypothetical protein